MSIEGKVIDQKIKDLGLVLPEISPPVGGAQYIPVVQSGNLLFVSGQISREIDGKTITGKLGRGVSVEEGQRAAGLCSLYCLAQVRQYLGGNLDLISRFIKVTGFVASAEGFTEQHLVINGASNQLIRIFGDAGRHARSAVGLAELPLGVAVEVEYIIELKASKL
eukprot:TRINITY_DN4813_c0_g3_i1.p1 TRINITY_DN4813_c0_g3~~TRINITY_DN4813_c0_g3_i1.p1  ORF type:complete len:165 (-),score=25.09 TRINITY_DN4813_c0_g3_i1:272-766(-)